MRSSLPLNSELKELAPTTTPRGLRSGGILDRLATLHGRVAELLPRVIEVVPRHASIPRLASTTRYSSSSRRPQLVPAADPDSYHAVWFEPQEDLIAVAGLTREGEAAAGRAD
jgi:hypothetical protein